MTISKKSIAIVAILAISIFAAYFVGLQYGPGKGSTEVVSQALTNKIEQAEEKAGSYWPWVRAMIIILLIHFGLLFLRWFVRAWEPETRGQIAIQKTLRFYNRSYVNLALIVTAITFAINEGRPLYTQLPSWIQTVANHALIAFSGFYIFKSFVRINENEMGIRSTLGIPGATLDQGLHFALWILQRITVYPRSIQSIRFAVESVPTKRGKVDGYPQVIEGTEVNVLFVIYYYFVRKNLKKTVTRAPGVTEEALGDELVPFTQDILRNLLGRMPWRLANEERFKFTQLALSRMTPMDDRETNLCYFLYKQKEKEGKNEVYRYSFVNIPKNIDELNDELKDDAKKHLPPTEKMLEKNSPFVQFGLEVSTLAIENLEFVQADMKTAISAPEIERLQKEATIRKAEGEKEKLRLEGEGAAKARAAMIKVIKENPDMETLLTLRELGNSESSTILYQIPERLGSKVTELLGGNTLGDLSSLLGSENRKFFTDLIEEAISKLQKIKSKGGA